MVMLIYRSGEDKSVYLPRKKAETQEVFRLWSQLSDLNR